MPSFHQFLKFHQELDRQAIVRYNHDRVVRRGPGHDDVFEDTVVVDEAAAAVPTSKLSDHADGINGSDDHAVDKVVFVDLDEEAAEWGLEQNAKESQRWEALPSFNQVRPLTIALCLMEFIVFNSI